MTTIFFALGGSNWRKYLSNWDHDSRPLNVLVTFADKNLIASIQGTRFARVMLDSGAFSAWNSGAAIDLDELTKESKLPQYTESVALDVIGDAAASVANALRMKAAGSQAFPVFHYNDPWEHLEIYKREFGRVGLSCRFGEKTSDSLRWLEQCFARAWPCRFHSFGWTGSDVLPRFPFDTADSTTWKRPEMFGRWRSFSRNRTTLGFFASTKIPARMSHDLRGEVESWLAVEQHLAQRWSKELTTCRGA